MTRMQRIEDLILEEVGIKTAELRVRLNAVGLERDRYREKYGQVSQDLKEMTEKLSAAESGQYRLQQEHPVSRPQRKKRGAVAGYTLRGESVLKWGRGCDKSAFHECLLDLEKIDPVQIEILREREARVIDNSSNPDKVRVLQEAAELCRLAWDDPDKGLKVLFANTDADAKARGK